MILSYHPCIVAERNALCAGRLPDEADLQLLKAADAVVLPQGCSRQLYEMARSACPNVWPSYDARFSHPGKLGQIRLFRELGLAHPESELYPDMKAFQERTCNGKNLPFDFPLVLKLDWGGEGDCVFRIDDEAAFRAVAANLQIWEKSGQAGFLLQRYIPCRNRTLRVAVIQDQRILYWRRQIDPDKFHANLDKGGLIDPEVEGDIRNAAREAIDSLCQSAGINLAGIDLIFPEEQAQTTPLFLEINYFFGRKGLGGSEVYYRLLIGAVRSWLGSIGMSDAALCH
ncbi:ATP-grasp domain-containing protein [Desulfatirhabdium butyrativorans]|uniref:ATP-grasp domain-containing protein n=1 Tax=Desulfatirhabdium butyrativorans TaxID=340467 RepID=UPI00146FBE69|nr:glutathione synthase [Desulfatirhabdium butyrativorans]